MNLIAKENKLPIEFVVKVVMVGFTVFMMTLIIFLMRLTLLIGLITGDKGSLAQFNLYLLMLPFILLGWGFSLGVMIKIGLMIYSRFRPINITIQ